MSASSLSARRADYSGCGRAGQSATPRPPAGGSLVASSGWRSVVLSVEDKRWTADTSMLGRRRNGVTPRGKPSLPPHPQGMSMSEPNLSYTGRSNRELVETLREAVAAIERAQKVYGGLTGIG